LQRVVHPSAVADKTKREAAHRYVVLTDQRTERVAVARLGA
jgi:hypothetical protein